MTCSIAFVVPAVPVAQPRQRVAVIGGRARTYTPTSHPVNAFKAAAQRAFAAAYAGPPLDGPLRLEVTFVLPRPQNITSKTKPNPRVHHTKRPDCDNLLKSLKDALSKLAWHDDSQVSAVQAVKYVAGGTEQPHVEVIIQELDGTELEGA